MRGNISWRAVLVFSVAMAILGLAGGNALAATTLISDGFEGSLGNWTAVGAGLYTWDGVTVPNYANTGNGAAWVPRDGTNTSGITLTNPLPLDILDFTSVTLGFSYVWDNTSSTVKWATQYSADGGSTWQTLDSVSATTTRSNYSKILNEGTYTFSDNALFRIVSQSQTPTKKGYVDDIVISGTPTFTGSYWDLNGATAGAGGTAPGGTWSAASGNENWNPEFTGTGTTAAWTPGGKAYFSAGTTATGTYAITVDGTQDIGGLYFGAGTVTLANGTSGALRMTSDNAMKVGSGKTATIAIPISDDGGTRQLIKGGAGTLMLSGNMTYTGLTTVSAGTLVLSGDNSAATGGMTVGAGVVQFESAASINGTGSNVTVNAGGAVAFGPSFGTIQGSLTGRIVNTSAGAIAADNHGGESLDFSSAGANFANAYLGAVGNVNYSGTLTPNGTTYRLGGGGGTLTMANENAIAGTGSSLIVNGKVTLAAANNYDGGTTVTAGILAAGNDGAIGSGALAINGGGIDAANGPRTLSTNNAVTIGGNFTFGGTNALNLGTGAVTNAGNRTITLNGTGSTLTLGGLMTNTSNAVQTTTVNGAGNTLVLGGYALSHNATGRVNVINGSGNVTIAGAVTHGGTATTGGLTYSGSGVLTLSGTNTYSGATTVTAGTLAILGSNSSAGATTLTAGTLQLGGTSNGGLASGSLTLTAGTLQAINSDAALSNNVTLTAVTVSGTQNLTMNGKLTGVTGGARTLTNNIGTGKTLTLGNVDINPETANARTLTIAGSGNTAIGGVIANGNASKANGLTITNTGMTTVSGANTYTGITTVSGGVLSVSSLADAASNSNIGAYPTAGAVGLVLSGGTLRYTGGTVTTNRGFTLSTANSTIDVNTGGTALTLGDSSLGAFQLNVTGGTGSTLSFGATTLAGAATLNPTTASMSVPAVTGAFGLTLGGTATGNTVTGVIGTVTGTVTKSNTGTWTLSSANTYTGITTVSGGTLAYGIDNAISTGGVTVNGAGAVLAMGTYSDSVGAVTLTAGDITGSGTLTSTASFTMNNAAAASVSVVLDGAVALTKSAAGTLTLSGANTYTGVTTISAGVLQFNSASAISGSGTGRDVTVSSGAVAAFGPSFGSIQSTLNTRILNTSAGTVALLADSSEDLDFSSAGANLTAASLGAVGSVTYSGTLTPYPGNLRLGGGGGTLTYSTAITGDPNVVVCSSGSVGRVILANTGNTYSGTTTISAGELEVTGTGQLGTNTSSKAIMFGDATATLRLVSGTGVGGLNLSTKNITSAYATTSTSTPLNCNIYVDGDPAAADKTYKLGNVSWFNGNKAGGFNITVTGANGYGVSLGNLTTHMDATIRNNAPGLMTINSIAFTATSGKNYSMGGTGGNIVVSANSSIANSGTFTKTLANTMTFSGNMSMGSVATVVNAGKLIFNGTTTTSGTTVSGTGTLGGKGSVSSTVAVNNGGTVAPGDPGTAGGVGTFRAGGAVTVASGGIYEWQLANGAGTAGTNWDLVAITGNLTLTNNWVLKLTSAGGTPVGGTQYDLFTFTGNYLGASTKFTTALGNIVIDNAAGWDVSQAEVNVDTATPGAGRVYITFGSGVLLGDINSDNVVDAADFINMKKNFTPPPSPPVGGLSLLTGDMGPVGGAPIPEPATVMLLVFGAAALLRRRRRS